MEAVGYLGGAVTLAGVMALLARWRDRVRRPSAFRLGAALVILGVAMIGVAYYVTSLRARPTLAPRARPSPTASALPTWTTYEQFYALSHDQQVVVIGQALARYDQAVAQAYRTFDASGLAAVATGNRLVFLQQGVEKLRQGGRPLGGDIQNTITKLVAERPPVRIVVVQVMGTERGWWLDPKTLQQVGPPTANAFNQTITF